MRQSIVISALCLFLGACGFKPLYGTNGASMASGDLLEQFSAIDIADVRDRQDQQLRNRLINRLTPRGTKDKVRYQLQFKMSEDIEGYGFRQDRAVTRERLQLKAQMVLIDMETGEPILEKDNNAWVAYDVVQSDFATVSAQRDARLRATDILADKMVADLSRYFRNGL